MYCHFTHKLLFIYTNQFEDELTSYIYEEEESSNKAKGFKHFHLQTLATSSMQSLHKFSLHPQSSSILHTRHISYVEDNPLSIHNDFEFLVSFWVDCMSCENLII